VRSPMRPAVMRAAIPVVFISSAGITPRIVVPSTCSPWASIACSSTYGAAAVTPGSRSAAACAARQSGSVPSSPISVACAVTDSMRVRSSRSKPFITESTTISTAMPSVRPRTELSETNDTNPRRCVERR